MRVRPLGKPVLVAPRRLRTIVPRAHPAQVPAHNGLLDEFVANTLQYVCPEDAWACQGLLVPDTEQQLQILAAFHEAQNRTDLYGLEPVLWNMLVSGDYETAGSLVAALQQYSVLVSAIRMMIGVDL